MPSTVNFTAARPRNGASTGDRALRSVLFHDATFLNAVLPFAFNQAKRHRESLSLLCVAIDRLNSVQDLLGSAEVERLVQHVGQTVGTLIRQSDIVARLDDNRIVAVLPRAPRGGALHVADSICRAVSRSARPDATRPELLSRSEWQPSRRVRTMFTRCSTRLTKRSAGRRDRVETELSWRRHDRHQTRSRGSHAGRNPVTIVVACRRLE